MIEESRKVGQSSHLAGTIKKSEIPWQISELDSAIDALGVLLSDLECRLISIMVESVPIPDKRAERESMRTELGTSLSNIHDRIQTQNRRISEIMSRLEI